MSSLIVFRRGSAAQWSTANPVLAAGEPGYETDTGNEKRGDGTTAWSALGYISLTGTPPSPNWQLIAWTLASAFGISSASRDANGAIITASVVWPDGASGTFTTDLASASFPGAIDAYHVSYLYGAGPSTKTITQAAVTRDGTGAVTAQPTLTVA